MTTEFNIKTGTSNFFTPKKDTHISRFVWNCFFFFSLYEAMQYSKYCGGKIYNELDEVVFDPNIEYNHSKFVMLDLKKSHGQ